MVSNPSDFVTSASCVPHTKILQRREIIHGVRRVGCKGAYCSLRNEMERNEMERNEMERNEMEMKICSLRNGNL